MTQSNASYAGEVIWSRTSVVVPQNPPRVARLEKIDIKVDPMNAYTRETAIRIARGIVQSTTGDTINWAELRDSFAVEYGAFGKDFDMAIEEMAPAIARQIARNCGGKRVLLMLGGLGDEDYPSKAVIKLMTQYVMSVVDPATGKSCEFAVCL